MPKWLDEIFWQIRLATNCVRISLISQIRYVEAIQMIRALAQEWPSQSAGQTETLGPATTWYDDYDPYDPPEEYQGA